MTLLVCFACGLLFGLGLIVSGMADPAKGCGLPDLAGAWDPSPGLVMVGAILAGLQVLPSARAAPERCLGLR